MTQLETFLASKAWETVHEQLEPEIAGCFTDWRDLGLRQPAAALLSHFTQGIYLHQHRALQLCLAGQNVCLSTSTSSGKTLVFQTAAIEMLAADPQARILAVYPLKALGNEQFERWQHALLQAGISAKVGRIDGGVPMQERIQILRQSRVVVVTPDIIHAWLLANGNLRQRSVLDFLRKLRLVILDEAHTYTGVFGSNSAYLFRRLNHLVQRLQGQLPRYISASATIRAPEAHLRQLTSLDFEIVDKDWESSPRRERRTLMLTPPMGQDFLTNFSELMNGLIQHTQEKFIVFVDSRKQTEYLASISQRYDGVESDEDASDYQRLEQMQILPYRSGYEEQDRRRIQERLQRGQLRGIVSTSALEMGLDIPYLTLAILVGVPHSATSYYQRIGRVGRQQAGTVLLINDGSVQTEHIFRNPEQLLNMPLAESALYLDNHFIQYIHALCLAREGGENDVLSEALGQEAGDFATELEFPAGFMRLCAQERLGEILPEFQAMKVQAGEVPQRAFPLRDIDAQFQVEARMGWERQKLGTLSYAQVLREAYPGAVYYYQTRTFRITRVDMMGRRIEARPEKRYTTSPIHAHLQILPNLSAGNIFKQLGLGKLRVVECNVQIRDAVVGFKERRGPNEVSVPYPINEHGVAHRNSTFSRNYFTSGVLFHHPAFEQDEVQLDCLAELLFESFLMTVPFERQDIRYGSDRHRASREGFEKGQRYLALFDQAYGSLRLSSRLTQPGVITQMLNIAVELATADSRFELNSSSRAALMALQADLTEVCLELEVLDTSSPLDLPPHCLRVILPGSSGLYPLRANEEFHVQSIFFSPRLGKLAYKGRTASTASQTSGNPGDLSLIIAVDQILEIQGVSEVGIYDCDEGDFLAA